MNCLEILGSCSICYKVMLLMKHMLKEIRCKGTSGKKGSTLLNITQMYSFVRSRQRENWNNVELGDCYICIGARM